MQDEDPAHRRLDDRIHLIRLGRDAEGHAQEIAGVAQAVVRVHERLAERVFVSHRRQRRHLRDQPMRGDHALLGIGDVRAVVIEGRQRADDPAHDRHRVRVTAEAAIEGRQLLMHHSVAADRVGEVVELLLLRKLAVQQQVRDFHEARIFGQLVDRVTAMQQDALLAVDIGDGALAACGRCEAGVVGEHPRFAVELADIDDFGTDGPVEHRNRDSSRQHPGSRSCRSFLRLHLVGDAGEAFLATQATPTHQISRETSCAP